MLQDGHYRIVFTTSIGTLGEGLAMVRGAEFVGADFTHHYRGHIDTEDGLHIFLRVERQSPETKSELGLPPLFQLMWSGHETEEGFMVEATYPGGTKLTATGTRMRG